MNSSSPTRASSVLWHWNRIKLSFDVQESRPSDALMHFAVRFHSSWILLRGLTKRQNEIHWDIWYLIRKICSLNIHKWILNIHLETSAVTQNCKPESCRFGSEEVASIWFGMLGFVFGVSEMNRKGKKWTGNVKIVEAGVIGGLRHKCWEILGNWAEKEFLKKIFKLN